MRGGLIKLLQVGKKRFVYKQETHLKMQHATQFTTLFQTSSFLRFDDHIFFILNDISLIRRFSSEQFSGRWTLKFFRDQLCLRAKNMISRNPFNVKSFKYQFWGLLLLNNFGKCGKTEGQHERAYHWAICPYQNRSKWTNFRFDHQMSPPARRNIFPTCERNFKIWSLNSEFE